MKSSMNFLGRVIEPNQLLQEIEHLITSSTQTKSTTTNGKVIYTDFGYVADFFNQVLNSIDAERVNND